MNTFLLTLFALAWAEPPERVEPDLVVVATVLEDVQRKLGSMRTPPARGDVRASDPELVATYHRLRIERVLHAGPEVALRPGDVAWVSSSLGIGHAVRRPNSDRVVATLSRIDGHHHPVPMADATFQVHGSNAAAIVHERRLDHAGTLCQEPLATTTHRVVTRADHEVVVLGDLLVHPQRVGLPSTLTCEQGATFREVADTAGSRPSVRIEEVTP